MSNTTTVIETRQLTGRALEWATGKAHSSFVGRAIAFLHPSAGVPVVGYEGGECFLPWRPLSCGNQTWELVETYIKRLGDVREPLVGWDAIPGGKQYFAMTHTHDAHGLGPTRRIAVCRAVVLARLGDAVEVPTALVTPSLESVQVMQ